MSKGKEKKAKKEKKETFVMPKVDYPKMEMPEPPKVPEAKKEDVHVSCEGEVYKDTTKIDNSMIADPTPGIPRILIGIPILNFTYEFVDTFLKFWTQLCTQAQGKMQAGYQFMYRKPVHMAEIQLAEIAVYNKCTHILFIDDDIYDYSITDLEKLLAADKDVISGIMYASKFPYAMCAFRRYDTKKKVIDMPSDNSMFRLYEIPCACTKCGFALSHWDAKFCPVCGAAQDNMIQKADLIPFCFTLMKTSIFKKIKKPWFHCEIEYPSDSWFADRCREAGIQEYAHMGVRLNHAGVSDRTRPYLFQRDLDEKKAKPNTGLVPISEDEMNKHQFLLNKRMKEAEEKLKPKPAMVTVGFNKEAKNVSKKKSITDDIPKEESVKVPG